MVTEDRRHRARAPSLLFAPFSLGGIFCWNEEAQSSSELMLTAWFHCRLLRGANELNLFLPVPRGVNDSFVTCEASPEHKLAARTEFKAWNES